MVNWTTSPAKKHVTADYSTLWFVFIRIERKSKTASAAHQPSWYQGGEKRSFCHASHDTITSENLSSKGNWPSVNTEKLWKSTYKRLHLKYLAPAIHWMLCLQVETQATWQVFKVLLFVLLAWLPTSTTGSNRYFSIWLVLLLFV